MSIPGGPITQSCSCSHSLQPHIQPSGQLHMSLAQQLLSVACHIQPPAEAHDSRSSRQPRGTHLETQILRASHILDGLGRGHGRYSICSASRSVPGWKPRSHELHGTKGSGAFDNCSPRRLAESDLLPTSQPWLSRLLCSVSSSLPRLP